MSAGIPDSVSASGVRGSGDPAGRMQDVAGLPVAPLRHYGRWVSAIVVLAICAFLIRALAKAEIDWSVVRQYFTSSAIFSGFLDTLLLTVTAMLLGLTLGAIFAVMRLSRNPVTSGVAWLYVWLFRGTPVLLQILLWFNLALVFPTLGLPFIGSAKTISIITPFVAALLGLGVNEGSYLAEIMRAGIMSVDEGQTEAATALGLSRLQSLKGIIMPQAMRIIIPPIGNETIGMLKTSSLAAVISYSEILNQAQKIYYVNGRVMELLIVAGLWYLIATSVLTIGQYYIERHLSRGLQRGRPRSSIEKLIVYLLDQAHGNKGHAARRSR
jgi:polar amino acid transport system permease protein